MRLAVFCRIIVRPEPMDNFVAIDFGDCQLQPSSICSIGAVKVVDGYIAERLHRLVRPEPNWYLRYFTEETTAFHGATPIRLLCSARCGARSGPWIGDLPLVAHNKAFDEKCLRSACRTYGIDYPDYEFHCTLQGARRVIPRSMLSSYSLPYVCEFMGITFFNHHDALADAEACAKIAMAIL